MGIYRLKYAVNHMAGKSDPYVVDIESFYGKYGFYRKKRLLFIHSRRIRSVFSKRPIQ